ncbi:unnamed protein product [Polarella glacialis]|uniref:Right handed beta helix domain-containing protein n=2 Tax=Polarella glacialis TaxID=89957 RepID=A0A813E3N2_POLGL|nr:unnamed protein product [Polarella glacialis]
MAPPSPDGSTPSSSSSMPRELVARVFQHLPPIQFLQASAVTCRQFSFRWYVNAVFPASVTVPDDVSSLNEAINRLARSAESGARGLLIVRPGTYQESVRVTQNCHILGLGRRDRIVVEAPGWESALVSAGLGAKSLVPRELGWAGLSTGEDACVENLTLRCRNENMRGRCVYLVMGRIHLLRCCVEGGVVVSGYSTEPRLTECCIRGARGSGLHLTDHCRAMLHGNHVHSHGRHGILIDRHARPQIAHNEVHQNKACGIKVFHGVDGPRHLQKAPMDANAMAISFAEAVQALSNNSFDANNDGDVSITPRYADSEAEIDLDCFDTGASEEDPEETACAD